MANEFDLLLAPGEPCDGECGSELFLNRERVKKPPKLERPVVDVEFLPLGTAGGVPISRELRPKELVVEDRSRIPRGTGGRSGDVFDEEARDLCESLRDKFMPGSAKDNAPFPNAAFVGNGGGFVGLASVCLRCGIGADGLFPLDIAPWLFDEKALVEARGVGGSSCGGESS